MRLYRSADGPALNVVRTGPRGRPPVVFIHAVGLDLTWWDQQVAAFGDEQDLVAFDLPGHGLSDPLPLVTLDALAGTAAEMIAALGAGPAHVVGISVGGMIAQELALAHPGLVRSLSLVATLCTFQDAVRTALRERARVARDEGMAVISPLSQQRWFPPAFRERRPDVLDRAAKAMLRHDPAIHAAMWDMIAELDLESHLPAITCPTMVVVGAEDGNAPIAAGEQISRRIKGSSLHVLPGIGHFPPVEAPAAFNDLLRTHLARA